MLPVSPPQAAGFWQTHDAVAPEATHVCSVSGHAEPAPKPRQPFDCVAHCARFPETHSDAPASQLSLHPLPQTALPAKPPHDSDDGHGVVADT